MNNESRIKSFTNLHSWQEGHRLVVDIYDITKNFPVNEQYGIVNQMRRAAVSITSNIAEGFSRFSFSEKRQFYSIAHGSLTELQNQLLIVRDVGYVEESIFNKLADQAVVVHKLLTGLIKSTREKSMIRAS